MRWTTPSYRQFVKETLREDDAFNDQTSQAIIPPKTKVRALLRAKGTGIACGIPLALLFFRQVDPRAQTRALVKEGSLVRPHQPLAQIIATARGVLSAERSALNTLQHLSGIATATREMVVQLGKSSAFIFDTRKTIPGWRQLAKYAVRCGGGKNHRMSLGDEVLIKENHIDICRRVGVPWLDQLAAFRRRNPRISVEIEVQSSRDLQDALAAKPTRILLDNLPPNELKKMILQIRQVRPRIGIEISGGISSKTLPSLRSLDIDRISVGRITHSAPALDISLDIVDVL